jgi:hypothetical protein
MASSETTRRRSSSRATCSRRDVVFMTSPWNTMSRFRPPMPDERTPSNRDHEISTAVSRPGASRPRRATHGLPTDGQPSSTTSAAWSRSFSCIAGAATVWWCGPVSWSATRGWSTCQPSGDRGGESPVAERGDDQAAPRVGGIRLCMAWRAERHRAVEIEVRAPLGALDDVVDLEGAPAPTGLAPPAGAEGRQEDVSRGLEGPKPYLRIVPQPK